MHVSTSVRSLVCVLASAGLVFIAGGVSPAPAQLDNDIACQAKKLKAAASYAKCHYKKLAEAVGQVDPADFTRCDATLTAKWLKAESLGGTNCPYGFGELSDILGEINAHADSIGTQLDASVDPEYRCEVRKLHLAGDHEACRYKTLARSAKSEDGPNFQKCNRKLRARWAAIDAAAGLDCPGGAGTQIDIENTTTTGSDAAFCLLTTPGPCS